ncbi:MAG TPA: 6-phosphogluconolactonase [Verrucomicrobiae bacterium]
MNPSPYSPALQVLPDYETMSQAAAAFLVEAVGRKPDALFCLPTGVSPARTYELLVAQARRQPGLFDRARWLKLDEWGGLAMDDPASCEADLRTKVIEPLRVRPERFFGWQSRPADPAAECRRVAGWLAANGPIDVCLLGLGLNGHLGLNEPAEALQPDPHMASLSETSLRHAMLKSARSRPQYGLTLGMADLLQSRRIVLLVSGTHKAEPLRRFFTREITTQFPASFLWLHPAVTIFCDRAAAARLPKEALP